VDCDINSSLRGRGTFGVQSTAWSKGLRVTADGTGVVSHVGAALLRMLADRAGLTEALSGALARRGRWPVHDRGRVLVDLAVMIADGGEAICDIDVLRHQKRRCSDRWPRRPPAGGPWMRSTRGGCGASPRPGRKSGPGLGTYGRRAGRSGRRPGHRRRRGGAGRGLHAPARAQRQGRRDATYKHTFGFHPILVTCDNTGELLAIRLRPGNAGANTAADHLDMLGEAFA
jgi:hypothetical protein